MVACSARSRLKAQSAEERLTCGLPLARSPLVQALWQVEPLKLEEVRLLRRSNGCRTDQPRCGVVEVQMEVASWPGLTHGTLEGGAVRAVSQSLHSALHHLGILDPVLEPQTFGEAARRLDFHLGTMRQESTWLVVEMLVFEHAASLQLSSSPEYRAALAGNLQLRTLAPPEERRSLEHTRSAVLAHRHTAVEADAVATPNQSRWVQSGGRICGRTH